MPILTEKQKQEISFIGDVVGLLMNFFILLTLLFTLLIEWRGGDTARFIMRDWFNIISGSLMIVFFPIIVYLLVFKVGLNALRQGMLMMRIACDDGDMHKKHKKADYLSFLVGFFSITRSKYEAMRVAISMMRILKYDGDRAKFIENGPKSTVLVRLQKMTLDKRNMKELFIPLMDLLLIVIAENKVKVFMFLYISYNTYEVYISNIKPYFNQ